MVMRYLLAVGACYLDTILTVEHYPAEDEKLRASSIVRRRGGNCPNTLEVLQQFLDPNEQDSPSLILCAVLPSSSSTATQEIRSSFGPTVDLTRCVYREECDEPASSYVIRSRSSGSRTLINYNELPEMAIQEFIAAANDLGDEISCKAPLIDSCQGRIPDITIECMRYIRQRFPAVRISVEVEKPARAGLQNLAAEANVVFYSKSWAQGNGYEAAEDCLRAQAALTPNASLLCCTWGHEGASALELPSFAHEQSPAFVEEKLQVVDTIGAGDTFISGMLYGLTCHSSDWNLSQKLSFANELAGRKVLQEGYTGLRRLMQYRL